MQRSCIHRIFLGSAGLRSQATPDARRMTPSGET
jgi:hypothetical protein